MMMMTKYMLKKFQNKFVFRQYLGYSSIIYNLDCNMQINILSLSLMFCDKHTVLNNYTLNYLLKYLHWRHPQYSS